MKNQITIETFLIIFGLVIIALIFFYFYIKSTSSNEKGIGIMFTNFQINSYENSPTSGNTCRFNLSFQASSINFNSLPITVLTENNIDGLINISINSTDFSVSNYPLSNNFYQYEYNITSNSLYPFNSVICNEFTEYQSSTSGKIIGIGIVSNNKNEVFKFSSPIPMYSS